MTQRMHFLGAVIVLVLSSANGMSQRHQMEDSVQNYTQEFPKSTGAHDQSFPRPNWNIRYKSGSFKLERGRWLKAAFASAAISHNATPSTTVSADQPRETYKQAAPILAITPNQLEVAYFDSKAEKGSQLVEGMARSGCHYAESLMPKDQAAAAPQVLLAWLATPGKISRAVEHFNRRYPVQVIWTDGGSQNEIVFTVNDCEYASFLANLRWFAGQRWQEIGHQLK